RLYGSARNDQTSSSGASRTRSATYRGTPTRIRRSRATACRVPQSEHGLPPARPLRGARRRPRPPGAKEEAPGAAGTPVPPAGTDTPYATVTVSSGGAGVLISVNKSEIGNTSDVNFSVDSFDVATHEADHAPAD